MSEVKGHTVYPVSNRCTSFSFHINQTYHSWDMSKRVFDREKTHPNFLTEICPQKVSITISPKSNQVISIARGIKMPSFDCYWILSKFLLINVTGVTLGQGHRKVIAVHFPRPIFFVLNMWALAQTVLTWEAKVFVTADMAVRRGSNELKIHHRPQWLNDPWKITDVRAVTVIFNGRRRKTRRKFFLLVMIKPRTYVN